MTRTMSFTAVYSEVEGGWVQGQLAEMPGVITSAPHRAEAEDLLLDALREYLLSMVDSRAAAGAPHPGTEGTVEVAITAG